MRVLVTGATGFIGNALAKGLVATGHTVRRVVRGQGLWADEPLSQGAVETVVVGDIGESTDWSSALENVDAVVHCAARVHVIRETAADSLEAFRRVNVAGTATLAKAAVAAGVKRFVYVSSIGVNGDRTNGQPFDEQDQPSPTTPYAISKWEAEQAVQTICAEPDMEVVIVRPPLVYGPGNPGNFLRLLGLVKQGYPLPFGWVRNSRSFVYIGNLVSALTLCVTHPAAAGQVFLVSDQSDVSTPELMRKLGTVLEKTLVVLPFPPNLMQLAARLLGKSREVDQLIGSLAMDSRKITITLGWKPPFTVDEGIAATAHWYRSEPS